MTRRPPAVVGALFAPGTIPTLVLDACVLYRIFDTDILLSLADADLLTPAWSAAIETEWVRNLCRNRPGLCASIRARARSMNRAFSAASVPPVAPAPAHAVAAGTTDAKDLHVVVTALTIGADAIVTYDLSDFDHDTLAAVGVIVVTPDDIVDWLLRFEDRPGTCNALRTQRQRMQKPARTPAGFIQSLADNGFVSAARILRPGDL